jgi:hypothetical protein
VTLTNTGSFIGAWACGIVLAHAGGTTSLTAWRATLATMMGASALAGLALLAARLGRK